MSKFGEIIDTKIPILFDFFTNWDDDSATMNPVLRDVAAALGDKAKVIKIDIDKNETLANALRVKSLPTFMIYLSGEMKWRHSGVQDANTLISKLQEFYFKTA